MKGHRATKNAKEIIFEAVRDEVKSKKKFPDTITDKLSERNSTLHVKERTT